MGEAQFKSKMQSVNAHGQVLMKKNISNMCMVYVNRAVRLVRQYVLKDCCGLSVSCALNCERTMIFTLK